MSKAKTLNLSRRSFLKVSAMAAAAAAVASTVVPKAYGDVRTVNPGDLVKADGDTKVVRTACRGCGKFECGVFVTVVNGRAVKVVGDDSYSGSMGNCCAKSQASLQAAYHPARLKYPMMRTNPKGENPGWKRITWDEALATIDEKMSEIEEKYGPSANCFFGGTSRIYAMGFSALQTLYNSQMSITPGQVCKGPRTTLTRNTSIAEMNFCENSWRPNLWIQWGSGIEVSNYDDAGRVAVDNASHADCYINIDARMSNLAKEASSRPGSFFMAPRPATDGAIALCWIKMIIDRELYDSWYVKRWTDCAFLVAEEMGPTPLSVSSGAGLQGTAGSGATAAKGDTVLLKESDVDPAMLPWTVEGDGDPKRFIVWDAANDRFTYLDSTTGLWEGERPFKMGYVAGSEWYMQAAKWNKFFEEQPESLWEKYEWGEVKGNYVVSARDDLTAFLPDQDAMPTVEGMEYATDPSLYSADIPEIKLKDGRTIKVETVFERLYANAEEWTPAKAAETTGIKEELFTEVFDAAFAKRYDPLSGVYQGSINYAVTHEHTGNAMKVLQCIEVLDVLRGVMDTPGGHRLRHQGGFGECGPVHQHHRPVPAHWRRQGRCQPPDEILRQHPLGHEGRRRRHCLLPFHRQRHPLPNPWRHGGSGAGAEPVQHLGSLRGHEEPGLLLRRQPVGRPHFLAGGHLAAGAALDGNPLRHPLHPGFQRLLRRPHQLHQAAGRNPLRQRLDLRVVQGARHSLLEPYRRRRPVGVGGLPDEPRGAVYRHDLAGVCGRVPGERLD